MTKLPLRRPCVRLLQRTLALLVIAATSGFAQSVAPRVSTVDALATAADKGRILGKESAPIWLLIVSDFQCPYCRQWHQETWGAVKKEFVETGKVRVAYMNFPLSGIHANARQAAQYAMCASSEKKFWEFADLLFETQEKWKGLKNAGDFFAGLAARLKLPAESMRSCLANPTLVALIDGDQTRMTRAGASSTPTFFVGRTMIEGAQPITEFRRAIDAELAAVKKR